MTSQKGRGRSARPPCRPFQAPPAVRASTLRTRREADDGIEALDDAVGNEGDDFDDHVAHSPRNSRWYRHGDEDDDFDDCDDYDYGNCDDSAITTMISAIIMITTITAIVSTMRIDEGAQHRRRGRMAMKSTKGGRLRHRRVAPDGGGVCRSSSVTKAARGRGFGRMAMKSPKEREGRLRQRRVAPDGGGICGPSPVTETARGRGFGEIFGVNCGAARASDNSIRAARVKCLS